MEEKNRKTGIDIIGDVPWGTHFCQFYQTKEDLIDILVPYFKAGLENNELCLWVTSEPLGEKEAREAMQKAVSDLDQYLKKGQIEIVPYIEWYLKDGVFNLQRVLNAWIDKLNQALAKGYDGLRVTGNTAWLEKREWEDFTQYEEEINNAIGKYQMIAICTYSLDKCGATEVIDVVKNHQFALIKREGKWKSIESSERKRAEEGIRSLAKFPSENPNPVLRLDPDGIILYANQASQVLLKDWGGEVNGYAPLFWRDLVTDALKNNSKKTVDVECGEQVYSFEIVPVTDAGYTNLYGRDITERKRAEEEQKKVAQEWNDTFSSIADLVFIIDKEANVVRGNQAFEDFCRSKGKNPVGEKCYRLLHDLECHYPNCPFEEVLRTKKPFSYEINDPYIGLPLLVGLSPMLDKNGEVRAIVHIAKDITKRKQAEEEIRKKNKDLETFVYMVSHDLKNPVVSIQGFCNLLLKNHKGDLNEKAHFYIERVQANASLMASLLEDLLELSRIGRIEDAKREISVQEVIKSVWAGVSTSLATQDVEFVSPENLPQVLYSEKRLYQIFSNLLSNALKFRDEDRKTKVEIGHQEDKDNYTFFVRDNGIGIEQKYHKKIFESFSQLKDTKSEGTGMGLAIVKKIVEANQGKVWVESQKGAGSTFYFTIPKNV